MNEQQLLKLKEDIDQAKSKVSELKGRQQSLNEQLSEEWGCSTIKEAEAKVKKLEKEITDLDNKINEGIKELEEKYDV